jgi:hypothetical protein
MGTRIVVNGQEYSSVDEMPPDVRGVYDNMLAGLADMNRNGVPDFVEQLGESGAQRGGDVTEIHHSSFTVNDVPVDDPSKLPPEIRRLYEAAMNKADAGGNIPLGSTRTSVTLNFSPRGSGTWVTFSLPVLLVCLLATAVVIALYFWYR